MKIRVIDQRLKSEILRKGISKVLEEKRNCLKLMDDAGRAIEYAIAEMDVNILLALT